MAPRSKRKTSAISQEAESSPKRRQLEPDQVDDPPTTSDKQDTTPAEPAPATPSKTDERLARFKALQARQAASQKENLKASQQEAARVATDPHRQTALNRAHASASQQLLKAETEAEGHDFERKRAWDWTAEEAERWEKRTARKERRRERNAFEDHNTDARRKYKRQVRGIEVDVEAYERRKMEAVERAVAKGGLEIVETDDGELIAVDRDGAFYSTADVLEEGARKPDKEKVDALVKELERAEELRNKKKRERLNQGDEGDVTYINIKVCFVCELRAALTWAEQAVQRKVEAVLRQIHGRHQG
jgi:pre-mRNA-splicing factor SYF2